MKYLILSFLIILSGLYSNFLFAQQTSLSEEHGSISCIVGNIDLPSRTQWRAKIKLPKEKAFFETETSWFNISATLSTL